MTLYLVSVVYKVNEFNNNPTNGIHNHAALMAKHIKRPLAPRLTDVISTLMTGKAFRKYKYDKCGENMRASKG